MVKWGAQRAPGLLEREESTGTRATIFQKPCDLCHCSWGSIESWRYFCCPSAWQEPKWLRRFYSRWSPWESLA